MSTDPDDSDFQSNNLILYVKVEYFSANEIRCHLEWPPSTLTAPVASLSSEDLATFSDHYYHIEGFLRSLNSRPQLQDVAGRNSAERELAHRLASKIFTEEFRKAFELHLSEFIGKRRVVLVIITSAPDQEQVPWELLGLPGLTQEFGFDFQLTVCRGHAPEFPKNRDASDSAPPILALISSAPLEKFSPNSDDEFERIRAQLGTRESEASLKVIPHRNIPYLELVRSLEDKPTVLHLATHGNNGTLDFRYNDGVLPIPYHTFIDDLINIKSIQLVVLNVCYSASPLSKSSSLARSLVEKGIPAVIGMGTLTTPRASTIFSERLYLALGLEKTIIEAFNSATDYLRNYQEYDRALWSVPMLYHSENVSPLQSIARHQEALRRPPAIPLHLIKLALNSFEEFKLAFKKIEPNYTWGPSEWMTATMSIAFLLGPLESKVKDLKDLPSSHNPASISWLFEFRDLRAELENRLVALQQSHDALIYGDAKSNMPNKVNGFLRAGKRVIEQYDLLRKFVEGH